MEVQKVLFGAYLCVLFWHGMCPVWHVKQSATILLSILLLAFFAPEGVSYGQSDELCKRDLYVYFDVSNSMILGDSGLMDSVLTFLENVVDDTSIVDENTTLHLRTFVTDIKPVDGFDKILLNDDGVEKLKSKIADWVSTDTTMIAELTDGAPNFYKFFEELKKDLIGKKRDGNTPVIAIIFTDFLNNYSKMTLEERKNNISLIKSSVFDERTVKSFKEQGGHIVLVDLNIDKKEKSPTYILQDLLAIDTELFSSTSFEEDIVKVKTRIQDQISVDPKITIGQILTIDNHKDIVATIDIVNPYCSNSDSITIELGPLVDSSGRAFTKEGVIIIPPQVDGKDINKRVKYQWVDNHYTLLSNLSNTVLTAEFKVNNREGLIKKGDIKTKPLSSSDFYSIKLFLKKITFVSQIFPLEDQARFGISAEVYNRELLEIESVIINNEDYEVKKIISDTDIKDTQQNGLEGSEISPIINLSKEAFDSINFDPETTISVKFKNQEVVELIIDKETAKEVEGKWLSYFHKIANWTVIGLLSVFVFFLKIPIFKRLPYIRKAIENIGVYESDSIVNYILKVPTVLSLSSAHAYTYTSEILYINIFHSIVCALVILFVLGSKRVMRWWFKNYDYKEVPTLSEASGYFYKAGKFLKWYYIVLFVFAVLYFIIHHYLEFV